MVNLQFDNKNSQKLRAFAQKFERPPPPDQSAPPQPKPRTDYWSRVDLPENLEYSNPLNQIIDKVPDVRYIFLYIVFHVCKLYPSLEQQGRPLLTPSSLTAYCLFLVYGFMLVNDYQGRTQASFWANDFMDSRARKDLYRALLRAYVPPFLMDIFHGLADTADPRRKGLEYFTTLAATMFETDFGRIIPGQIFLYAHNLCVEIDTSRNVATSITNLLSWAVWIDGSANSNIHAAQYFSAGTEDGTYHSFMYKTLSLLFSPITGKSIARRPNLQEIPCFNITIDPAQADDTHVINPYLMFLNASNNNMHHMISFIQEFSAIVKADIKAQYQLGAVPDALSGVSITNHGYTIYALPTWHNAKFDGAKIFDTATAEQYASKIGYLQEHKFKTGTTVPLPDATKGLLQQIFLRLIKSTKHDPASDPDHNIKFDVDEHVYPKILWLLPYEEGDGPVGYAMFTGSHIETFEVDGTSVPQPNAQERLSDNNSQYAQGAIPIDHVVKGYGSADETRISPITRAQLRARIQQISIDLYDLSQNRLGRVDAEVEDGAVPNVLFGFDITRHVRGFKYMYSKISFKKGNDPNIDKRRLPVWSPYRLIHNEGNVAPLPAHIFMMLNFRAMYGTHIPLIASSATAQLMPTS